MGERLLTRSLVNDKDKLLRERDKELDMLRVQLTQTGVAKNQAESSLADSLRKEKQALQAKDAGLKELEKNLRGKLHALETQLSEKQELLQNRNTELDALRSQVTILTGRLTDATTARERAEQILQQDLKKKTELLQSKDATYYRVQLGTFTNRADAEARARQVVQAGYSVIVMEK